MGLIETAAATPTNWLTFKEVQIAVRVLLVRGDASHTRESIQRTAAGVARACRKRFAGHWTKADKIHKPTLQVGGYNHSVSRRDISFASHSEHEMLNFSGVAHVAYHHPTLRVVGRLNSNTVVEIYARRLQVQDRESSLFAGPLDLPLKDALPCL